MGLQEALKADCGTHALKHSGSGLGYVDDEGRGERSGFGRHGKRGPVAYPETEKRGGDRLAADEDSHGDSNCVLECPPDHDSWGEGESLVPAGDRDPRAGAEFVRCGIVENARGKRRTPGV